MGGALFFYMANSWHGRTKGPAAGLDDWAIDAATSLARDDVDGVGSGRPAGETSEYLQRHWTQQKDDFILDIYGRNYPALNRHEREAFEELYAEKISEYGAAKIRKDNEVMLLEKRRAGLRAHRMRDQGIKAELRGEVS